MNKQINKKEVNKMIDLTYKRYTNKDYLVDEINNKTKSYTIDRKDFKKDLRKLKTNTLLELLLLETNKER